MFPLRLSLFALLLLAVLGLSQEAEATPTASFTITVKSSFADDDGVAYNGSNVDEDYSIVVFNASSSSPGNYSIDSYSWDFYLESTDSGNITSHVFPNPGNYWVILTVTDTAGNSDTEGTSVKVNDVTPPSAAFTWYYIRDGDMVTGAAMESEPTYFNASSSSDNSPYGLTYEWDFGDGETAFGVTTSHTFENLTDDGFNVVLTVTDSSGNTDVISYNIQPAHKQRPDLYISELSFSNDNPEIGEEITINATVKLLGMELEDSFEVTFYLDDMSEEWCLLPHPSCIGRQTVHRGTLSFGIGHGIKVSLNWNATAGTHTIYVVADSTNKIDESEEKNDISKFITVGFEEDSNEPVPGTPTAIAGQDVVIIPGGTVQFNGAGTDEDGTIVKYEWDFDGDGVFEWSSEENGRTTNIYNNAGTYDATLRVTDNEGNIATDSLMVTVKSPEEEDSRLPSLSLLAVVSLLGMISVLRRR